MTTFVSLKLSQQRSILQQSSSAQRRHLCKRNQFRPLNERRASLPQKRPPPLSFCAEAVVGNGAASFGAGPVQAEAPKALLQSWSVLPPHEVLPRVSIQTESPRAACKIRGHLRVIQDHRTSIYRHLRDKKVCSLYRGWREFVRIPFKAIETSKK